MELDLFAQAPLPGAEIIVKVTANTKKNRIISATDVQGQHYYRVYVTAPPSKGEANAMVIKLLAQYLNVPKTSLSIISGATSNIKRIKRN